VWWLLFVKEIADGLLSIGSIDNLNFGMAAIEAWDFRDVPSFDLGGEPKVNG
jgi:hypothetical protein